MTTCWRTELTRQRRQVLERLVLARLRLHLLCSTNFSQFQSAYRKGHCTEVLDSVYTTADNKQVTDLVGLDLSAAFDTVSHDTLLDRLQREFGVTGTELSWIQSYLSDRSQFVKLGHHQSPAVSLNVGVPQGSVLGPLLFAVYCSPVFDMIAKHGVYSTISMLTTRSSLSPCVLTTRVGLSVLVACTSDVKLWYIQTGLPLNPDKSEALIVGTSSQLKQVLPAVPSLTVTGLNLPVSEQMKVLGVILDRRLTFQKHATAVAKSCNYHAQATRHV